MIYIFVDILAGFVLLIMNNICYLGNLYEFGKVGVIWTFFLGIVLVADCLGILFLLLKGKRFLNSRRNHNNQKELEIAIKKQAEDQRSILLEEKRLQAQQRREEEEIKRLKQKKREAEAKAKADDMTRKYSLESFEFDKKKNIWSGKKLYCNTAYLNTDIMDAVGRYGISVHDIYPKSTDIKRKSSDILCRRDFSTECDRLQYLTENRD